MVTSDQALLASSLRPLVITAVIASVFNVIYVIINIDPYGLPGIFIAWAPSVSAVLWIKRDAAHYRVRTIADWGWFALLLWPVLIPWYVLKTRGLQGWPLLLKLFALIFAPTIVSAIVYGLRLVVIDSSA